MSANQEVYFNNIRGHIIRNLERADNKILIAVAWFTDTRIMQALLRSMKKGVKVSIILFDDKINTKDSFESLYYGGAEIRLSKKLMHNKFCIIDNDIVINGSYNWTNNAATNDENIQVTSGNKVLANQFIAQYESLKNSAAVIDSHFKYRLDVLKEEEENFEYYYSSEKPRSGISFPYFYKLEDLERNAYHNKNRLKDGIYIIKNEQEEIDFFRYCFYLKKDNDLNKLEKLLNRKFVAPDFVTRILRPFYNNFTAIPIEGKKFLVEYDATKYSGEILSKYVYWIDAQGNIEGNKTKYRLKFSNGYYYSGHKILYDPNLNRIDLNFHIEKLAGEIGFISFSGSYSEIKYGLYSITGECIVKEIYDDYLIKEEEGRIKFFEYDVFKIKDNQVFAITKDEQRKSLRSSGDIYASIYVYMKQIKTSNRISSSNRTKLVDKTIKGSGFSLSWDNGIYEIFYMTLYHALLRSGKSVPLDVFVDKRSHYSSSTQNVTDEAKWKIAEILTQQYDVEKKADNKKSSSNSACYVATMVYKDINHPKVQVLRDYRDTCLRKNLSGKIFIHIYYKLSPYLVKFAENHKFLQNLLRNLVVKIVDFIEKKIELKA